MERQNNYITKIEIFILKKYSKNQVDAEARVKFPENLTSYKVNYYDSYQKLQVKRNSSCLSFPVWVNENITNTKKLTYSFLTLFWEVKSIQYCHSISQQMKELGSRKL